MTTDSDDMDALLADGGDADLERTAIEMAERRRIGIAAANQYLLAYLGGTASRDELAAFEHMAIQVCGIGVPFSATGERDLSPEGRAREFLAIPELAFHRTAPAAQALLGAEPDHR